MRTLLNLIWLVFGGLWMALGYAVAALVCFVLVVTVPWGIASWRNASYALWPFGRTMVPRRDAGVGSALGNIVWLIVAGWWLALGHIVTGIGLAVTIIGIPLAIGHFKLVPVALLPLGHQIASTDRAARP